MPNLPTKLNNPGDLRYAGQDGAMQDSSGFAKFSDPKQGMAALLNDLQTKINNHPNWTLADLVKVYAPPSENNSAQYAADLANKLHVRPDATLKKDLEPIIGQLADSISGNEGYQGSENLPGVGALGGQMEQQISQQYPQQPMPTPPPPPTPFGDAAQPFGEPDQNGTPMKAATSLTNSLGLGGTTDVFGQDIAHYANPKLADKGLLPLPTAEQNAGAIAQTGGVAASALFPESIPLKIALGAGLGSAQMGGSAMTQNAPASQVAQQAGLGGGIGAFSTLGTEAAAFGIGELGKKSLSNAIRPTQRDINDGFDRQFAIDNGLTGNAKDIARKSQAFIQNLTNTLKTKFGASGANINLQGVFAKTLSDLTSQEGRESNFLQNTPIESALGRLQNEVDKLSPDGNIPLPSAQTVKQQTGMYGEWLHGAPDPEANAMSTVANTFYHNIKKEIEDQFPEGEIAGINKQIQGAIPVMRAAIRRIPITERNNALSLTDMMAILGFPLNPAGAVAAGFNHAMNSGLASSIGAPIQKGLTSIAPAVSSAAPGLLGSVFPQFNGQNQQ